MVGNLKICRSVYYYYYYYYYYCYYHYTVIHTLKVNVLTLVSIAREVINQEYGHSNVVRRKRGK